MKKVFIFILIVGIVIGGFVLFKEYIVPTETPSETAGSMDETTEQAPPPASTGGPNDNNNNNSDKNNETTTTEDSVTTSEENITTPERVTTVPEESTIPPEYETSVPEENTTAPENETTVPEDGTTDNEPVITEPPEDTGTTDSETTATPDIPDQNQPSDKEDETPKYPDEDIVLDLSANIQSQDIPVGAAIYISSDGTFPYTDGQKIVGSVSTDSLGDQIVTFGEFKAVYISAGWSESQYANVSDPYLVKADFKDLHFDDASIKVVEAYYYDQHVQTKTIYTGIVYLGESGLYLTVNGEAMKPGSTGGIFWISQIGNDLIGCQILVNRDPKYIGDNITVTMFDNQGTESKKLEILAENVTPGMVVDISEYITENVRFCSVTTVDVDGTTRTMEGLFYEDLSKAKSIQCCIIKDNVVCYITLIVQH